MTEVIANVVQATKISSLSPDRILAHDDPDERDANRRKAKRYAAEAQKTIDARRAGNGDARPVDVKAYGELWIKERRDRGVRSARNDEVRLRRHAFPHLGTLRLDEVTPMHVRDMVRALRKTTLAPRSILHVYMTLHNMFESAEIEGRVVRNPVKVKRGELPTKRDKRGGHRGTAVHPPGTESPPRVE